MESAHGHLGRIEDKGRMLKACTWKAAPNGPLGAFIRAVSLHDSC